MIVNITKKELEQLPILNLSTSTHNNGGNIYLVDEKVLYKVFKDFCAYQDEIERNIQFQIVEHIPYTPVIYSKLYIDNKLFGYAMEYIKDSLTFRTAIGRNIEESLKINAITNIYESLKYLHKRNIYLGDIYLDNFLISIDGSGYIIDLDCMRFLGDEYKFQQCYLIKPNNYSNKINIASKYTDNIKVMLSCLSLLLEIDLENYVSKKTFDINLQQIFDEIIYPLNDSILNDYFKRLMSGDDVEYFSDYYLCSKNKKNALLKNLKK